MKDKGALAGAIACAALAVVLFILLFIVPMKNFAFLVVAMLGWASSAALWMEIWTKR